MVQGQPTLEERSIEAFGARLRSTGRAPNTVVAYQGDLRLLVDWAGKIPLDELDESAAAWITHHRRRHGGAWSNATTRRRKAAVRAWARWAGDPSVLADYKAPTPPPGQAHPITEGIEGVRSMIEVAESSAQRAVLVLCGFMGLRAAEALQVTPTDVDLGGGKVLVHGKGDRDRVVPIPSHARAIIEEVLTDADEGPLVKVSYRTVLRWVARLGEEAGLSRSISTHDLRHTAGTHAWRKSQDLRTVQALLGHADPRTTTIYTAVTQDAIAAALEE